VFQGGCIANMGLLVPGPNRIHFFHRCPFTGSGRNRLLSLPAALRLILALLAAAAVLLWAPSCGSCAEAAKKEQGPPTPEYPGIAQVLEGLQERYAGSRFCASFRQESTLKAMQITDEASGSVCFKHPDKMRWQYTEPEEQLVVSDGRTFWIYRPLDHQVMVGETAAYFGDGKGASFLSDMGLLESRFTVGWAKTGTLADHNREAVHVLELVPKNGLGGISVLYLVVSRKTLEVVETVSYNPFGDETRIRFSDFTYDPPLDDAFFSFRVPEGVDIIRMDER